MRSGKISRDTPAPSLSNYEPSLSHSVSRSSSSIRRPAVAIPALNFDRPRLSPPPPSPQSPTSPVSPTSVTTPQPAQSLLQRHLAHLTRHGINGVSSAPGDVGGSDSLSVSSPRNSFVNVGTSQMLHTNGMHSAPAIHASGNSVMGYNVGSMGSLGSIGGTIRGRISRFGSLNFGKQKPSPS
jgi:dedicator of cytokinesis protein 3